MLLLKTMGWGVGGKIKRKAKNKLDGDFDGMEKVGPSSAGRQRTGMDGGTNV